MDIPSIKFRYFEKLKLWHDYLSPSSIFESQKKEYWEHEKIILLWAYSDRHQHLYASFGNDRIFQLYGINKDKPEIKINKNIVDDLKNNKGKVNHIKGNLDIKGFAKTTKINERGYPEEIRILPKGLLLGEIIFEAYSKDAKWYQKDFLYYKLGLWSLKIIIAIAVLSLVMVFIGQLANIFTDDFIQKRNIDKYDHRHTFNKHL